MNKLEIIKKKIVPIEQLQFITEQWHILNKRFVFTNGCFDLLHEGHNTYLLEAASLGEHLIVAINTDSSVKKIKGNDRPILNEYARALNLASHTFIDFVILFDQETPLELIQKLRPHVLVKGGDYKPEQIVGSDFINSNGGSVVVIPFVEGNSTSSIIDTIKKTK